MFNNQGRGFKLPKVLSREDAAALLAAPNTGTIAGLRDKVAMIIMYRAGLRVSEVCNLMVDDVDLKQGFIFVQQGKGDKDRVVPMDQETISWCKQWLGARQEYKKMAQSEHFLCTRSGKAVLDRYLRVVVAKAAKKAGVYIRDGKEKKLPHPHTLRHCYLTELMEDGFNIQEVQAVAGHSSIITTAKYLWARPEQLAQKIRGRQGVGS